MAVDTKRIISTAKKNGLTITAGVVALVAIAVPFVVADGWMAETQTNLDQRAGVAKSVQEMGKKARTLPQVDPDAADKIPLDMFPSKSAIEAGENAKKHLAAQAEVMLNEALKLNVRRPLLEEVFKATPQRFTGVSGRFREEYLKVMPAGLNDLIKGGIPRTAEEIALFLAAEKDQIQRERAVRSGGQILNQDELQQLILKAEQELPQRLRNDVALRSQVYLSTDTWQPDTNMVAGTSAPSADSIWFAQLGLWIQEEVARIVLAANGSSPNVFQSPVKHLVKVSFVQYSQQAPTGPYILPASTGGGDMGTAAMVPLTGVDPAAPVTLSKGAFLTGRQASGLYDVVHFNMVVRVAESQVTTFLASIPRGRLVNVLNVNLSSIDSSAESAAGYIYGNEPVVQLVIECEMLFLRRWTETLMPARVRQIVGIDAPPAAPGMP